MPKKTTDTKSIGPLVVVVLICPDVYTRLVVLLDASRKRTQFGYHHGALNVCIPKIRLAKIVGIEQTRMSSRSKFNGDNTRVVLGWLYVVIPACAC